MKNKILNELLGIAFLGLGGYLLYVIVSKGMNTAEVGIVGKHLYSLSFLLLGRLSFALPFVFFLYSIIFFLNREIKIDKIKLLSFIMFFVLLSSVFVVTALQVEKEDVNLIKEILKIGGNRESGGMIGAIIALAFFPMFGKPGALIIISTLMLINLFIFANEYIKGILRGVLAYFLNASNKAKIRKEERKLEKIERESERKSKIKKFEKKRRQKKTETKVQVEEETETPIFNAENFEEEAKEEIVIDRVEELRPVEKKKIVKEKIEVNNKENEVVIKEENYDLVEEPKVDTKDSHGKLEDIFEERHENHEKLKEIDRMISEKVERLEEVLEEYGIEANVINYERGPVITRFELAVARGTRVKKVTALESDLKMNLEAKSIRIEAPIPGKNAIGIEIPNDLQEAVYFSKILKSKTAKSDKSPIAIILGKNIVGDDVVVNLGKMPHLLIAGRTGSGKSVCINSLISSIISRATHEEVKFILVDPKMVELMPYNDIPHLLVPVIIDPKQAAVALKWAVNEMEERYKMLAKTGVRNLEGYNKLPNIEKLPYIVVIIDELADLMMVAPASIEESIARIAQKARAIGIHLVVATQRPSTDVITGTIKANLPSRISFSVASQIDSRTILDTPGADKLLGRGDMLFLESGKPNLVRIQGAFISDDEVGKLTGYLKRKAKPSYDNAILEEDTSGDVDELYHQAIETIKEAGKVSTSLIQRKLKIGYSRAARIIDQLEENGIISSDKEILLDA